MSRRSAIALGVLALMAGPARHAVADSGEVAEAVVVSATGEQLESGNSATPFSLRLPDDAACPGSSEFEGWLVNSYMVHASTEPADVAYDGLGPTPPDAGNDRFRQPLFAEDTARFVSAATASVEREGTPGRVVGIPMFSLAVYTAQDLRPGRYHLGIACTLRNEVGRVWDAEVVVSESSTDEPGGFTWEVASSGAAGEAGAGTTPLVPLGGVAVLASVVLLVRRRRGARALPTHEGAS